jgi:hypothetical protein
MPCKAIKLPSRSSTALRRKIYIDRHLAEIFSPSRETHRYRSLFDLARGHRKGSSGRSGTALLTRASDRARSERAAVEAAGVPWKEYNDYTQEHDERLKNVPNDLDLTPYRNEKDFQTLQRIIGAVHPWD